MHLQSSRGAVRCVVQRPRALRVLRQRGRAHVLPARVHVHFSLRLRREVQCEVGGVGGGPQAGQGAVAFCQLGGGPAPGWVAMR